MGSAGSWTSNMVWSIAICCRIFRHTRTGKKTRICPLGSCMLLDATSGFPFGRCSHLEKIKKNRGGVVWC